MNQERSVTRNSLAQGELLKSRSARALGTTGLALMLGKAMKPVARALLFVAATALVTGIAVSRLALNVHSEADVIAGGLAGLATLALYARIAAPSAAIALPLRRFAAASLVVILAMHGVRWPIESHLHRIAALIDLNGSVCS